MSATTQPLRCLLVEDEEDDAKLILRELRARGYGVTSERVDTPEALRAALERAPWDLVISDFSMPQFSGLDALKILQASGRDLPFILVSGAMGEETAVNAMRAGAHDYLLKDKLTRLGPAVQRELREAAQRHARCEAELALIASEERFRRAIVDAPIPIMIHADDGAIIQTSRMWQTLTGYTAAELVTIEDWTERAYGARKAIVLADIDALYAMTGPKYEGDYEVRTKSGEVSIWEFSSAPLGRLQDGRRLVISMAMDVTERRSTQRKLSRTKQLLESTGALAKIGGWEVDLANMKLIWTSETFRIAGIDKAVEPALEEGINLFAPAARPVITAAVQAAIDTGTPYNLELPWIDRKGRQLWVITQGYAEMRDGKSVRLYGTIQDITERKRVEARIEQLSGVLHSIRAVMQMVVRERDPQKLLLEACQLLAQTRGYRLVWVGQAEAGSKRVRPAVAAGLDADYLQRITITWDESATGLGPTGTAMRTRHPVTCDDMRTDPRLAPWREAALSSGFASSSSVPMLCGERLFGVLTVYADHPAAFNQEEVTLLGDLASDLAYALQGIEGEAARKQAEAALLKQTEELHAKNTMLERFNAVVVGREMRMIELKREVNELCAKVGEPPRHRIAAIEESTP